MSDDLPPDPLWVFYDGECEVCSRAVAEAGTRDRDRLLRPAAVQSEEARARLGAAAGREALDELHVWSESGGLLTGVDAVAAVAQRVPGGRAWAGVLRFPLLKPLFNVVYRQVARRRRHRHWPSSAGRA